MNRAILLVLLAPGCADEVIHVAGDERSLLLVLHRTQEPDPVPSSGARIFGGYQVEIASSDPVQQVELALEMSEGETVFTSGRDGFAGLAPTSSAQVTVSSVDLGDPPQAIGIARAPSVEIPEEGDVTVRAFLGAVDAFTRVGAGGRSGGNAVVLSDGRILLVGGRDGSTYAAPAVYDPTTGETTVPTAPTELQSILFPTLVALGDGEAYIAGGVTASNTVAGAAYLFRDGAISLVPGGTHAHVNGVGIFFAEQRRLVIAGGLAPGTAGSRAATDELTLIDLSTATPTPVSTTETLTENRANATVIPLAGMSFPSVLVAGGIDAESGTVLDSAELIEIPTGADVTVTAVDPMASPRTHHCGAAFVRANGRALIYGGLDGSGAVADGAPEIFDASLLGFQAVLLPTDNTLYGPRVACAAASLSDGSILVTGGTDLTPGDATDVIITDASHFVAISGARAADGRVGGVALPLPDGSVFVTGGNETTIPTPTSADPATASDEIFVPACATPDCR